MIGGKYALVAVLTDFTNFQEKYQVAGSSQVVVKKNSNRGGNRGEKGEVCPSSIEPSNYTK